MSSSTSEERPLAEVAHLIGMDYQALRTAVLRRECEGRLVFGRWVVTVESALRLRDARAAQAASTS